MCPRLSCLIIVTISNKMTERRVCDVIRVNERIFVRSFVKPKNIRLLGFDIRFTTSCNEAFNLSLVKIEVCREWTKLPIKSEKLNQRWCAMPVCYPPTMHVGCKFSTVISFQWDRCSAHCL